MGTDLFNYKTFVKRVELAPNSCLIFKTDNIKWHGFSKRKLNGKRKVLIVNFVDKENWNSKDQVWDS